MDFLAHMSNRAYLDICPDVRLMFFEENGFPPGEFERLGIGPVVRTDTLEYFRELRLLERFSVTLALAGISPEGSRFRLRNEFLKDDGRLAARVTSEGGWLALAARKLVRPPAALVAVLGRLERSDDYQDLQPSVHD
jgi:acyl-CoA thioester hydrolase